MYYWVYDSLQLTVVEAPEEDVAELADCYSDAIYFTASLTTED